MLLTKSSPHVLEPHLKRMVTWRNRIFKDDNPFLPFDIHSEQVQKMYQMSYDFFLSFLAVW